MTTDISYGLQPGEIQWEQGFRATRDDTGAWIGSESFQVLKPYLTKVVPKKGAPCQYPGRSYMLCTSVNVENLPGSFDRVTVNYGGNDEDGTFEFDDEEEDFEDAELNKYTYELSINVSTEPIETNSKFRNISREDRDIIYNLLQGNLERSKKKDGELLAEPYTFYRNDNPDDKGKAYLVSEENYARELVDYILNGVTGYQRARQIWRVSYNSPALPAANILNFVGYITSAKGAPALADGRNWLFTGIDARFENGVCATTLEFQLSETGGWDTFLYKKELI